MYGFVLTKKNNLEGSRPNYCRIEYGDYVLLYNPLNKFENDKLLFQDENRIYLFDGVVFNKTELCSMAPKEWKSTYSMLVNNRKDYMESLRGSFCGITIDKQSGIIEAFTNHSGEHTIYYAVDGDEITIFSNIMVLKEWGYNKPIEADTQSCLELLSVGGVLHGSTPYKNVCRLMGGKRLEFLEGDLSIKTYHKFSNFPETSLSFEQCIDRADELFLQAVKRMFEKNREYGYRNECDLSGGLDSRLAYFAARRLRYQDILNVCYSQQGSLDHTISKKICDDHNGEYVFVKMDGEILKSVDAKTKKTGGQIDYILYSGAVDACEKIKDKNIGITCMGLLGEISKGEYVQGDRHTEPSWCGNNRTTFPYVYPQSCTVEYGTYEELNLYERGFNIIVSSIIARQQYVEAYSPFIDPDFMDFVLSIPIEHRQNCHFEIEWMKRKYPEAASYIWQRSGKPVKESSEKDIGNIGNSSYGLALRVVNKMLRSVGIQHQVISKFDMGPIEKWYINDSSVRKYFDSYYADNIDKVKDVIIKGAVEELWKTKQPYARAEVVNLLAVYKNIFCS